MRIEEDIISDLVRRMTKEQDATLCRAFEKHFGFPIAEVQDKENLECRITQGSPVKSFCYRGETFLYLYEPEVKFKGTEASIDVKYREV